MAPKERLLASAGTIQGIQRAVREFYVSDQWSVDPETLALVHPSLATPQGLRVELKRDRYRFVRDQRERAQRGE